MYWGNESEILSKTSGYGSFISPKNKGEWMKRRFIGTLEWIAYKKKEGEFRNVFSVPDQSSHSI